MGMKKGRKHYPNNFNAKVVEEQRAGSSVRGLRKKYGVSRWSIYCWCGLRPEKEKFKINKNHGRPRKTSIAEKRETELHIKDLEREVDLLQPFLRDVGRM